MSSFTNLFSPIKIGNVEVPNRICHVATDISPHTSTARSADATSPITRRIARGGTGFDHCRGHFAESSDQPIDRDQPRGG